MKKLCVFMVGITVASMVLAETSKDIDTVIHCYTYPDKETYIYAYYVPVTNISGFNKIAYEYNPIILKRFEKFHIPSKNGYYVIIKDIESSSKKRAHFSTCNNFMAINFNHTYASIDISFNGDETGYCGVYPSPD